jgi:arylsulfatase
VNVNELCFNKIRSQTRKVPGRELWRFVYVQRKVAELAQSAIEYPPMQAPASFNLEAVKAQVEEAIKSHTGQ